MKKLVQVFVLMAVVLTLGACGKSEEQKAQDRAQDLTQEQNSLSNYVNDNGMPSPSWSDQKLNEYEGKLNRLEQVESQLRDASGHDGVIIYNADNSSLIKNRRAALDLAREIKKLQGTSKAS